MREATEPEREALSSRASLHPELIEWAKQGVDADEVSSEYRELLATGGVELDEFLDELEQEATSSERTTS